MKTLQSIIIFIIGFILLSFSIAHAETSFSVTVRQDTYENKNTDSSLGIVGKIAFNDFYLWGGLSNPRMKWGGQPLAKVQMLSGGIGLQHEFEATKRLTLMPYIQIGYYMPDVEDQVGGNGPGTFHEALFLYSKTQLPGICDNGWPWWYYDIDPGFGGEIGGSLNYIITNFLSWIPLIEIDEATIGVVASYRILELQQTVIRSPEPYSGNYSDTHHEFYNDVNFGGWSVGANFSLSF